MIADATQWIAVDWGTTNLRAWVMGMGSTPLATLASDKGMGGLPGDGFEPALLELIAPYLPEGRKTPVICCGMVGAAQGWAEAPYARVPCAPPGIDRARAVRAADPRLDVRILPGVSQTGPDDVMRGEETQIAGYLVGESDFDGILCLPGTHTKWVHISAGEIVSFRTFMTGEMFSLLADKSVLRHTVTTEGWDDAAFAAAIGDAMSHPQRLGAELFSLRAGALVSGLAPETARARLSGLLLGLELSGARPWWLGQRVVVIGAAHLARLYQSALAGQGADATLADGGALTLAGLIAAHDAFTETRT